MLRSTLRRPRARAVLAAGALALGGLALGALGLRAARAPGAGAAASVPFEPTDVQKVGRLPARLRERIRWWELERATAHSGSFPGRAAAPDFAAARELLAADVPDLRARPRRGELLAALDVDTSVASRVVPYADGMVMQNVTEALSDGLQLPLSDELRRRLALDTVSRYLPVWRRVARGGRLPRLWPYRPDLGGATSIDALPLPRFASSKDLAYRNAAAAILAFADGDHATAERRARENVAMGDAFLRVPTATSSLVGRNIVANAGTLMMTMGWRREPRDSAFMNEGIYLRYLAHTTRGDGTRVGLAQVRDDDDTFGLAAVRDTSLPPALRVHIARAVIGVSCQSAGELALVVFDGARRARVVDATRALADIDQDGRLASLILREYDAWDAQAASRVSSAGATDSSRRDRALRAVGLGGVAARLRRCDTEE